jgi:hypothetical protein
MCTIIYITYICSGILFSHKEESLVNLTRKGREKIQISKTRGEKGDITTHTNEIQRNIREYFENLFSNKLKNLMKLLNF